MKPLPAPWKRLTGGPFVVKTRTGRRLLIEIEPVSTKLTLYNFNLEIAYVGMVPHGKRKQWIDHILIHDEPPPGED